MFDTLITQILAALTAANINAVRSFPAQDINTGAATVCVSVKSAEIIASGCGSYIGLCTDEGVVKEMYGSSARLELAFNILSPSSDCDTIKNSLYDSVCGISSLTVKNFKAGDVSFDKNHGMFFCPCTVSASLLLVQQMSVPT